MNCENLYEGEEINGETTLYIDKKCTIPYTGHVEYYFKGKISWECDIVKGLQQGIEKIYCDDTGKLERVSEVKQNRGNGLSIEYYKNWWMG